MKTPEKSTNNIPLDLIVVENKDKKKKLRHVIEALEKKDYPVEGYEIKTRGFFKRRYILIAKLNGRLSSDEKISLKRDALRFGSLYGATR